MSVDHVLYPLSLFCGRDGSELPPYRLVEPAELPEPDRGLLVHERDMTSVLQEFHAQELHLRNLEFVHENECVLRQVLLLRQDEQPAEFGAIDIRLPPFAENAQAEIIASHTPLGAILNRYHIGYSSAPSAFFEIDSGGIIGDALGLDAPARLFGRTNVLRTEQNQVMARVVEILPPSHKEV